MIWISFILLISCSIQAQIDLNMGIRGENAYLLDRMEVLDADFKEIHSSMKPVLRSDVLNRSNLYYSRLLNKKDSFEYDYIKRDHNDLDSNIISKKPFLKILYPKKNRSFLKHFYKSPAHFLEFRKKDFYLNINPILHFKAAYDFGGNSSFNFLNKRGVAIRGNIANRLFFYSDIVETQAAFPAYVSKRINNDFAVPGAGFFKIYDSSLNPGKDTLGVDFLMSEGYIGFNILKKHCFVQLGHGKHFIGDGHRSLFLSDYSSNYFYLKLNTKVWKINYQNLFAELIQNHDLKYRAFDLAFPKKYLAAHHLSINVLKNLNIGLFEAVVFSREGKFDFQYLNPIIFYRSIEQAVGSPDNVLIGLNWKWNFVKGLSFYGQFVLDELSIGDLLRIGDGWWANKYALQCGLKYYNFLGLDHFDLQAEFNMSRPYIYSFRDSTANYTHYNQPLAHPLGSNFYEWIGILNYRPIPGFNIRAQFNYVISGIDTLGSNWGVNPAISYLSREQEQGNFIGQGLKRNLLIAQLILSYQLRHNMFLELECMYRRDDYELDVYDNNSIIIGLGFRWNIANTMNDW